MAKPSTPEAVVREAAAWLDLYDRMAAAFFEMVGRSDANEPMKAQALALIPQVESDEVQRDLRDAADEIVRLRAEVERLTAENEALNRGVIHWTDETLRLTAERDAALAALAQHEALVAELRERADDPVLAPVGAVVADLLARHGLGGDA